MACTIIYNDKGSPRGVKDAQGNPSRLFKQLSTIPYFRNFNDAINPYTFLKGKVPSIDSINEQLLKTGLVNSSKIISPEEMERELVNERVLNEGVTEVQRLANEYKKEFGIVSVQHSKVSKLEPSVSKMIAEAYEQAETDMTTEEIKDSYQALENETLQQYSFIINKGLKVSRWLGEGEPYTNSKEMLKDLKENKHLYFLPNSEGFGKDGDKTEGRFGLKPTDVYLEDGYRMTLSEVFRVVHDYFGHGILGNQFGAIGEENATLQHLDLYSSKALPAVIFQTRGQNSWVNFSGVNEQALRKIKEGSKTNNKELLKEGQNEFVFATPKDSILPKIFNFKTYETARRIKEQKAIKESETSLDQRGTYEDSYISETLSRHTSNNSGKLERFSRRELGTTKRVGDYDVNVVAEYQGDSTIESTIKNVFPTFVGVQKIYEITDGNFYRELMLKALEGNKFKSSVTVHSAEDFSKMRLFVTEDGSAGVTLTKDGFLGGGFGNPKSNRPNNLSQLLLLGVKEGAITAEAFDTVLPNYYSMFGFKAVSRTAFNDDFRPLKKNGALEDWDFNTYKIFNNGRPDIVFFIYDGGDRNTIQDRLGQFDSYSSYQKEFTEYYDKNSYEQAYRFMEIEAINKGNYQETTDNVGTFSSETNDIRYQIQYPLVYKSKNGETYSNLKDVINSNSETVSIGVLDDNTFVSAVDIDLDKNPQSINGLITSLIGDGLIEDVAKIDTNGDVLLVSKGTDDYSKAITSDMAKDIARKYHGSKVFKIGKDFNIKVTPRENTTVESIEDKTIAEFKEFSNEVESDVILDFSNLPDNELIDKLLTYLNNLGVKITSIEAYSKKYKLKNGVSPSAEALADLANNIIAFRNGEVTEAELIEEVSHFIIDSLEESEKQLLKDNIHQTSEWAEFAETYYELYAQQGLSGEALDSAVREEILGKVLAKSLKDNFQKEQNQTVEGGIVGALKRLFNNFMERVNNFFKDSYQIELEQMTYNVYKNLMNNFLSSEAREVNNKKFVLYSANVKTSKQQYLEAIYNKAVEYDRELRKKHKISSTTNTLNRYKSNIKTLEYSAIDSAIEEMLSVLNTQVNIIKKAVERAKRDSNYFSQEENSVYQSMRTVLFPMLSEVKGTVENKGVNKRINKTISTITDLMSEVPKINLNAKNVLIDRVIKKHNMTNEQADKYRESIGNIIDRSVEDTAWLHAHLGGLLSARDPLLNLAGEVIERTQYDKRRLYQKMLKSFLTKLDEAGFDATNLKKLIYKGEIINEVDADKKKQFENTLKSNIYNKLTKETTTHKDIEEKLLEESKKYQEIVSKINNSGSSLTKDEMDDLIAERELLGKTLAEVNSTFKRELYSLKYIPYLDPEFTKKRDEFFIIINGEKVSRKDISEIALNAYNQKSKEINDIIKVAGVEGLSSSDKAEIRRLDNLRNKEASPRKLDGTLKEGIKEEWSNEFKTFIYTKIPGTYSANAEIEADKVIGLQQLMLLNREFFKANSNSSNQGIPQKFLDELNKQATESDKLEWLYNNSTINFEQTFWDSFDPNESLIARLSELGTPEADKRIEKIRRLQTVIKTLLKENTSPDNPSSSSVFNMDVSVTSQIKVLQQDLDKQKSKARELLGEESFEGNSEIVSTVNEAYRSALTEENITLGDVNAEVAFILRHVTDKSAGNISDLRKALNKIKAGENYSPSKYVASLIEGRTDYDNILLEEARKRLLPYFKRTEPEGFTRVLEQLKEDVNNNVTNAVLNYINNPLITVRPSWSFFDSNSNINPEWLANKNAGREQYSKDYLKEVGNQDYQKRYNIVNGVATTNTQEWAARKALLEFHDEAIEAYGLNGVHDRYQLPQMLKSATRRILGSGNKVKAVKEVIRDWSGIREDDMDLGQNVFGNIAKKGDSLLTIPRYGVTKVKDQSDVTDELLMSYAWFAEQSALYKSRKENISDMLALEDFIMHKGRDYSGKAPQASNTAKMFKSFLNSNFYGVQESFSYEVDLWWGLGKVDLGKLARTFNNWVRFSNLAGITVPLTSAIQGKVQEAIEAVVKESINPVAYRLAQNKVRGLSSEAAGEIMKFRATSELNTFLEFLGVYNISDRLENSNLGRGGRTALVVSNGVHQLGNFPVTSTVAYAVALDYRIVNGKIITQKQYKAINKSVEGWEDNKLLYDFIKVRNGAVEYDRAGLEVALGTIEIDDVLNTTMEAMSMRALSAIQRVDSQIPQHQKSIASRNAIANFFLMHMNWFLVAVQNKTKHRHFNLSEEGMEQEGNWRTVINMISQMAQNPKEIRKIWNKNWKEDEMTQRNILRFGVEIGVVNALAVAAILLSNAVDDDDDPAYLLTWADYMLTRVAVEQTSSSVGLISQVDNIISNPIVAYQRLKDLRTLPDLALGNDIVEQGNYAGDTKRYRAMVKNLPLMKDYHKFRDWTKARQTYQYFNLEENGTFRNYAWASRLAESSLEDEE